jgi:hypothetical protein
MDDRLEEARRKFVEENKKMLLRGEFEFMSFFCIRIRISNAVPDPYVKIMLLFRIKCKNFPKISYIFGKDHLFKCFYS